MSHFVTKFGKTKTVNQYAPPLLGKAVENLLAYLYPEREAFGIRS